MTSGFRNTEMSVGGLIHMLWDARVGRKQFLIGGTCVSKAKTH